ncbi:DNA mismatch repair protein [Tulasnella sp. 417]|nr:DNA mismatch repair protein [Tulasnella sp. 417]
MELIRRDIERYALMSPHVSFTLEKSTKDKDGQTSQTRVLTASSSLAAFHGIFGRSLAEHVDELNVKRGELLVEGFISLRGAPSKTRPLTSSAVSSADVNRSPVEVCELHRLIDGLFACSSFAKQDGLEDDQYASRYSPRKAEWKPVYCLNLHIPREAVDVCLDPDKRSIQFQDRQAVESLLSFAIQAFLERNGFTTVKTPSGERPGVDEMSSSSPRKRIKSEIAADTAHAMVTTRPLPVKGSTPRPPPDLRVLPDQPDQRSVAWRDPNTGEVFIIDSRTGNTIPASRDNSTDTEPTLDGQCSTSYVDRRWLKRRSPAELGLGSSTPSLGWIQSALDACQSSVFQAPETTIRAIATRSLEEQQDSPWPSFPSSQVLRGNKAPDGIKHRFARSDLQGAKVVCQVDKKFIACVVQCREESTGSGSTLILIDQHAADERVRVEHFFKELASQFLDSFRSGRQTSAYGVERTPLPEPTFVLLSRNEIQRLQWDQKLLNYISRSGFEITTPEIDAAPTSRSQPTSVPDAGQAAVTAVPKLLYTRLSKPAELSSVLKAFISMPSDRLAEFGQDDDASVFSTKDQLDSNWLNAVKAWPQEFINLVNSKACRGEC